MYNLRVGGRSMSFSKISREVSVIFQFHDYQKFMVIGTYGIKEVFLLLSFSLRILHILIFN
jgi:hypothetical protein